MTTNCTDKNCYIHGTISVRGGRTEGRVVTTKAKLTAVVELDITRFLSKYRRWAKEHSKIPAHNPACIGAKIGDLVTVGECRKISKTKAWTVLEIVKPTQ